MATTRRAVQGERLVLVSLSTGTDIPEKNNVHRM